MTLVKKAEDLARLVNFCSGFGGKYNPGRPNLQLEALNRQLKEVRQAMENVSIVRTEFDNEVNQRIQIFRQLPRLASGILRILEASGATPEKIEDARFFVRQISGNSRRNRKSMPSAQSLKTAAHHAHLQLAYVSRADAFSKLVKTVETEPLYQPNENWFRLSGLTEKVEELNGLNRHVAEARGRWSKMLIARNDIMYRQEASLTKTGRAVKKYLRAIFGHNSAEYALVKPLDFNQPPKKSKMVRKQMKFPEVTE